MSAAGPFKHPFVMAEENLLRINKAIAQAGVCSRRKADEYILAGRVRVNGQIVDSPGLRIDPHTDRIEVDGALLSAPAEKHLYIALHKPPKIMTTFDDPQGRKTVIDLLPSQVANRRPVPVGRLDFMSEGLLLMSTDGELTHRLTHPRYHLPKVYRVGIKGRVDEGMLQIMRKGMRLAEGDQLAPVGVQVVSHNELEMTLMQGVNRQIRRMCRDLGLGIRFLRRVAQGPVSLGTLKSGEFRHLTPKDVAALKKAVGLN